MKDLDRLKKIIDADERYSIEAYLFVFEALAYTRKRLKRETHVTGQELLTGIVELAHNNYGLMAKTVFQHWGITRTIDFGHIVFNLVNAKLLSKTDEDRIDDFKDIFDFDETLIKNYEIKFRSQSRIDH